MFRAYNILLMVVLVEILTNSVCSKQMSMSIYDRSFIAVVNHVSEKREHGYICSKIVYFLLSSMPISPVCTGGSFYIAKSGRDGSALYLVRIH